MDSVRFALSVDGLTEAECASFDSDLRGLPDAHVKALRTRDPAIVESFLVGIASSVAFELALVIARWLLSRSSLDISITVETRTLRLSSSDPGLDPDSVARLVADFITAERAEDPDA